MTDAGTTIGPYEIVEQIGSGGMATVYKAHQPKLDRYVAIKVMHKMFQEDQGFLARFEREARIVARLDHPHIVPIYDYDKHDNQPYLVMKYVEGRTLKSYMKEKALTLDEVKSVMRAVCDALTYAHREGVLHRDMKPSNIIIDKHGTPYLTDFGLARIAKQGESTLSIDAMLGTPHYISPEQAQGTGDDLDARTDVYATGIILYELMTGRLPFTGDGAYSIIHKQIYAAPPQPSRLNPEIPPELDKVLLKALEKNPADRYDTPNALMTAFEAALSSTGFRELDSSRVEQAARLGDMISEQTPGGGSYHSITLSERGKRSVIVPVLAADQAKYEPPLNNWLDLAVERFRQAIDDVFRQVRGKRFSDQVSAAVNEFQGSAERIRAVASNRGEQESATDQAAYANTAGAARKRHVASMVDGTGTSQRQMTFESWGVDDDSIRQRAQQRLALRRNFVIHLVVYGLVITGLFMLQGESQQSMLVTFQSQEFIQENAPNGEALAEALMPLADLPWALVVAFMWGTGLVGHALKVYSNTGDRLTARQARIENEMRALYGPDWRATADAHDYQMVRQDIDRQEQRRINMYTQVLSTIMMIIAGYIVLPVFENMIADILFIEEGLEALPVTDWANIWALIMLVVLGMNLVVNMLGGLAGRGSRERAIQREIVRERQLSGMYQRQAADDAKPKREVGDVRLTEDGEFTESFIDGMNEDLDQQRR